MLFCYLFLSVSLPPSLRLAEASEWGSEVRRWGEPAAGGGLIAKATAGVSTELCCGRGLWELPAAATRLHRRLGGLCEADSTRVR